MTEYWEKELKDAVWSNRPDLIENCIKNGVNVDFIVSGGMGRSQLFVGIIHQKLDAVKCLLEAGANPNLADDFDKTPMQHAKSSGLDEFVVLLKAYGGI